MCARAQPSVSRVACACGARSAAGGRGGGGGARARAPASWRCSSSAPCAAHTASHLSENSCATWSSAAHVASTCALCSPSSSACGSSFTSACAPSSSGSASARPSCSASASDSVCSAAAASCARASIAFSATMPSSGPVAKTRTWSSTTPRPCLAQISCSLARPYRSIVSAWTSSRCASASGSSSLASSSSLVESAAAGEPAPSRCIVSSVSSRRPGCEPYRPRADGVGSSGRVSTVSGPHDGGAPPTVSAFDGGASAGTFTLSGGAFSSFASMSTRAPAHFELPPSQAAARRPLPKPSAADQTFSKSAPTGLATTCPDREEQSTLVRRYPHSQ